MKRNFNRLSAGCPSFLAAMFVLGLLAGTAHTAVIGQWTFNEGGGTIALDSSGQDNHAMIQGGATYVSTSNGLFGISLDGIDDFVDFGQPAVLDFTTQAWTIEAWISIDTDAQQTPEANHYGIFGKNTLSWLLGYEHGGSGGPSARHNVMIGVQGGTPTAEGPVDSARPSNTMYHLLATKGACDGPGCSTDPLQFYINGVCQGGCDSGGRLPVRSEAVDVVAGLGNGNYLECVIDELIVHDVRMNPGQAADQFNAGPSPDPPDLSFLFPPSLEAPVQPAFSAGFVSVNGLRYQLERTTNPFTPGSWTSTGPWLIGSGGTQSMFDAGTTGTDSSALYRIVTMPSQ